jgi:hypothetical protein
MLGGIARFFNGAGFDGLWIAFIGCFLMDAAQSSYAQLEIAEAFRGMRVSEVMFPDGAIVNRAGDSKKMRCGRPNAASSAGICA